jgi:hypothetical protein
LKAKGYPVFGAGIAEKLETDRPWGRSIQEKVGLPTQPTETIIGITKLKEYLQDKENKFIKINQFRGDIETFKFNNMDTDEIQLDFIAGKTGIYKDSIEFIIEDEVGDIEPGYDGIVVDGKYPDNGLFAYELKGSGYVCRLMDYVNIPEPIRLVNDRLTSFFERNKTRSLFSTEVRVDKNGTGYLIDPTIRAGMPCPTSVELEMYKNFPEIIWNAGQGIITNIESDYKFGCGVALDSEWATEHWLSVILKDLSIRPYVKFRRFMIQDNNYYVLPGFSSVCSIIGLGNTIEDAVAMCEENVSKVKGFELDGDTGGLSKAIEEARNGQDNYNLNFFD